MSDENLPAYTRVTALFQDGRAEDLLLTESDLTRLRDRVAKSGARFGITGPRALSPVAKTVLAFLGLCAR